jgi:hypothetical protein
MALVAATMRLRRLVIRARIIVELAATAAAFRLKAEATLTLRRTVASI